MDRVSQTRDKVIVSAQMRHSTLGPWHCWPGTCQAVEPRSPWRGEVWVCTLIACKLPGNASVVERKALGADPSPPSTSVREDTFGTHFPELSWLHYSNIKDGEKSL